MNKSRAPKILVTGINGQVGYELLRATEALGTVMGFDRQGLDLADAGQIRQVLRDVKPDIIINPAAYTAVDKAEDDLPLATAVNGTAPGVLAEEAKRLGALLVHFSTDYVFDGRKVSAYTETDTPNPANVYGRTKLQGEQAIAAVGCAHAIFRTSWVYGIRGRNFLLTMLRLFHERPGVRVVGDQHGAPTWARSIAGMTALALARGPHSVGLDLDWWRAHSGIYHMTAAGSTTWAGFATAIAELAAFPTKPIITNISTAEYPTPATRPTNSRLALDKLQETFDIVAPRWEASLALCLEDKFSA